MNCSLLASASSTEEISNARYLKITRLSLKQILICGKDFKITTLCIFSKKKKKNQKSKIQNNLTDLKMINPTCSIVLNFTKLVVQRKIISQDYILTKQLYCNIFLTTQGRKILLKKS